MVIAISKRLQQVANYIPNGSLIADIGSDHAYLPCYTVQSGVVPYAIAGEVNKGPYLSAWKQVKALQLSDSIDVRLGNGLDVMAPNEVSVVIVAGMGGQLIQRILNKGKNKLSGVQRLVLQPNVGARFIREWLQTNQWKLIHESILDEEGKIYEILVAEPTEIDHELSNRELLLGPYLLKEANSAFQAKWKREVRNWERILNQLNHALPSTEIEERQMELQRKISIVKGVLS